MGRVLSWLDTNNLNTTPGSYLLVAWLGEITYLDWILGTAVLHVPSTGQIVLGVHESPSLALLSAQTKSIK